MKKGDIIQVDGKRFKIQKVIADSIYASLVISGDKCQRGKPRRFRFDELAKATGMSVEAIKNDLANNKAIMKEQLKQSLEEAEVEAEEETMETSDEPVSVSSASSQKSPLHDVLNQYESDESDSE